MTIEDYFGQWFHIIDIEDARQLAYKLSKTKAVLCPCPNNVFRAFTMCSPFDVRVVILGQDPYPNLVNGKPVATGLAFANCKDTPIDSISPSLKVLRESVIDFTRPHGITNFDISLESWKKQGVMLLNSALSCEAGKPGSHTLLWRPFIKKLLLGLSHSVSGIIYILLGNSAQSFRKYIEPKNNFILEDKHPAWYVRNHKRMPSDIWYETRRLYKKLNGKELNLYTEQLN